MQHKRTGLTGGAGLAALLAAGIFFGIPQGGPASVRELSRVMALPRNAERLGSAGPWYAAPPPFGGVRGVLAPWRVGVQAGHWHIADLPIEQWRLRHSTGTRYGVLQEVDVNLEIARRVVSQLADGGVSAELLPATVPAGYEADAFVAIHADGGERPSERGWKVASPWRSSPASRLLRDSVAASYGEWTGMPEDRYGVTFNMRGYYAFSWYRFSNAVAPTTPSMIIEAGFLSSEGDRNVLSGDPERAARGISSGILLYLARRGEPRPESLVARVFPPMRVAAPGVALRLLPGDGERSSRYLPAGTVVRPVGEEEGWVDLIVWGNYRVFGWVRETDLEPLGGA